MKYVKANKRKYHTVNVRLLTFIFNGPLLFFDHPVSNIHSSPNTSVPADVFDYIIEENKILSNSFRYIQIF